MVTNSATAKAVAQATKPGYLTTEFWVSLITGGLMLLTTFGVLTPTDSQSLNAHVAQWSTIAVALISSGYAIARAIAKHNLHDLISVLEGDYATVQGAVPGAPDLGDV